MNRNYLNEAGKCTWHAWQEGKTYAFPEEVLYADLEDFDPIEQKKLIAAGFTDSDRVNVIFPKGSVFTVKSMHGPGGGNPVIEFYKIPDMEFDVYCEDYDDTLYSIVESRAIKNNKMSKNESKISEITDKIVNEIEDTFEEYAKLGKRHSTRGVMQKILDKYKSEIVSDSDRDYVNKELKYRYFLYTNRQPYDFIFESRTFTSESSLLRDVKRLLNEDINNDKIPREQYDKMSPREHVRFLLKKSKAIRQPVSKEHMDEINKMLRSTYDELSGGEIMTHYLKDYLLENNLKVKDIIPYIDEEARLAMNNGFRRRNRPAGDEALLDIFLGWYYNDPTASSDEKQIMSGLLEEDYVEE